MISNRFLINILNIILIRTDSAKKIKPNYNAYRKNNTLFQFNDNTVKITTVT